MNRSAVNGHGPEMGNSACNGGPAARNGYLGDERLNGPWHWWYLA